jgi:hypothetical protein
MWSYCQPCLTGITTFSTGDEEGTQSSIAMAAPTVCMATPPFPRDLLFVIQTDNCYTQWGTNMAMCF